MQNLKDGFARCLLKLVISHRYPEDDKMEGFVRHADSSPLLLFPITVLEMQQNEIHFCELRLDRGLQCLKPRTSPQDSLPWLRVWIWMLMQNVKNHYFVFLFQSKFLTSFVLKECLTSSSCSLFSFYITISTNSKLKQNLNAWGKQSGSHFGNKFRFKLKSSQSKICSCSQS